jgi:hypothetical protein
MAIKKKKAKENHVVIENVATMMGPPHFLQWPTTSAAICTVVLDGQHMACATLFPPRGIIINLRLNCLRVLEIHMII